MKNRSFKSRKVLLLAIILSVAQIVLSQKTITGIITDGELREPLIGATVLVKGQTNGTVTDLEGKFSIKAQPKDVLIFSYIGMESQEVQVQDKTVINIELRAVTNQLSEVVSIGYQTVKKTDLTGAVAVVSAKDLTRSPSSSAAQALQGKAPGVLVFQNGAPGGGATIRVRGVGSISKGSNPIYIVDGVQVGSISNIQPQDIENIQVLKDASSTAIYGANGSNGVVIINTKRGKSGKVQANLNSYIAYNQAPNQYEMMNATEYANFYKQINGNKPEYDQYFREQYYGEGWEEGTNWQDYLFKDGLSQNYNLSLAGGGENSNFNVSLNYIDEEGTVLKTNSKNYTIRANSDFKLGDRVKIGENVSLSYGHGEAPISSKVQTSVYDLKQSPLMKVYNDNYVGGFESCSTPYWIDDSGNLHQGVNSGFATYVNTINNDKANPLAAVALCSNNSYSAAMRASVYFQFDITKWLSYKVTPSAEFSTSRTRQWIPYYTGNRSPGIASLTEAFGENLTYELENQLSFNKKFNSAHNVQAILVSHVRRLTSNFITGASSGFDFEELNTLSNGNSDDVDGGTNDYRMLSYLGRVMYDYQSKYYATFSLRSDGVSLFSPYYRRGNFASTSIAWRVNEDFLKDVKEIDALKLRFGWGQTGNSNIGYYQYYTQVTGTNMFSPVFGVNQEIAPARYSFYQLGSSEIHWEASDMYNFGVDLNMFNNRLVSSFEYYIKNTNNLLVQIPISSVFGAKAQPWYNLGKIQNKGIEFSVQWRDHIGEFNYGISANLSTVKNIVKYLPVSDITTDYNRTIVGHSIGALYGYVSEGIIQLDESNYEKDASGNWQMDANGNYTGYKHATQDGNTPQPGDIRFADINGDGNVTALDRTIIGKTIPSFNYTFGFDCSYKDFDINVFFYGIGDFDIYNYQRASLSSMNTQDMDHNKLLSYAINHWTINNPSTDYIRVDPSNTNLNDRISTFWIEDGSFLRVKDIQVGYNVPKKTTEKLGLSSLRMYANASNIYCFTNYQGRDPEGFISSNPLSGGYDAGGYTLPKSFTFGLQVGF